MAVAVLAIATFAVAGAARRRSIRSGWQRELSSVRREALVRPACDDLSFGWDAAASGLPIVIAEAPPVAGAAERASTDTPSAQPPPADGTAVDAGGSATGDLRFGGTNVRIGGGALLTGQPVGPSPVLRVAGETGWISCWPADLPREAEVTAHSRTGPPVPDLEVTFAEVGVRGNGPATFFVARNHEAVRVVVACGTVVVRISTAVLTLGRGGSVTVEHGRVEPLVAVAPSGAAAAGARPAAGRPRVTAHVAA